MKSDVAIIIVSYNSALHIEACLESLFNQQLAVRQQVIMVDNASCDETVALVQRRFPDVEVLLPGLNLGFAAGVNLAVQHAHADFVLLLNPDTVILNHAVDVIVDFARRNPGRGLYGGRTLNLDGSLEPSSCWGAPTLWSMAMFALGMTTFASGSRWLDPEALGGWARDSVREVGVITGCFLLAQHSVWDELGGMDERYFMYGEDVDLALRARSAGYHPTICPDATLVHEVGQSSESPLHKSRWLFRAKASLVRNHWKGPTRRLGLLFLELGTGLRALHSSLAALIRNEDNVERWLPLWRERASWLQGYATATTNSKMTNE